MSMHSRLGTSVILAMLTCVSHAQVQEAGAGLLATPGRPGSNRTPVSPVDNDLYRSTIVELGGGARVGLLYEPKTPGPNSRVAVLYSDRNFGVDAPVAELASRGYRALYVSYPPLRPGEIGLPFDGFLETSRGIAYLRSLPGVERVVIEGWGAGAGSMTLYANVAAHGPAACQGKEVIYPCSTEQATGLAKPDGVILLDPGAGTKASNIDPAYDGNTRGKLDLDMFAAGNGYDSKTGTAKYSADFRKRYFAAQQVRNDKIINDAIARLKVLDQVAGKSPGDEPLFVPGAVNAGEMASLSRPDLSLLSHTKRPHILLKADGTKPMAILRSVRPTTGPVGYAAVEAAVSKTSRPASAEYSLREYLANDASRTTRDFALTEDDIVGVVWKSALTGTPANAEGVSVPSLVITMTCFQFVVPSEITYDHLAAKDKTLAGVEGSEHEFKSCGPQYGDVKKRLFDFIADWLGEPRRF